MPTRQEEEARSALRVPVEARVKVQCATLGELVNANAANLSLTGMFVETRQLCPVGTLPNFELKLNELASVKGVGEVVWSRPEGESAKRPAGMGVRFLQIDQDSLEAITLTVDRHIQRGGGPFELVPRP